MRPVVALLVTIAFATAATAAPRKVLVLPLDGTADAAITRQLTATVQKLARVIDGQVKPGDSTFTDAAAAVGCDPKTPACVETVRTTLGVDELVYGTASQDAGTITVVVRRKAKDQPPRELVVTLAATDSPDRIEATVLPLFTGSAPAPEVVAPAPQLPAPEPARPEVAPAPARSPSRARVLGIASVAGGGAMLLVGFALWQSKAGLQDDIDGHPTATRDDFRDLQRLEDQAQSRALFGNLMVASGLALGGLGAWLLWRDHQARVRIAPVPLEGGAGVTVMVRR
jgi:hypothetical protein